MTDPITPRAAAADPPTSTGLAENVAGALAYLLGPITGILFLVLERKSSFVRFHAAQSIGLTVAWIVFWVAFSTVGFVLGMVPVIGWMLSVATFLLSLLLGLGGFALWLVLMLRAWQGREWELPLVGAQSRRLLTGV